MTHLVCGDKMASKELLDMMNQAIAREIQVAVQYMWQHVQWSGVKHFAVKDELKSIAIEEMKHAEKLIERILFFDGTPIVSKLNDVHIGSEVEAQHRNDLAAEVEAVKAYNESIRVAAEVGDNGTRELLESILEDEEKHVDWLEAQLDQIRQMGIQNYLVEQID